jgi:hypothetical protein
VGLADSRKVTKLTKNDLEVLSLFTFHFSPFTSPIPICVNLRSSAVCLTSAPLRENFFCAFCAFSRLSVFLFCVLVVHFLAPCVEAR